jgi:acetoin utilization deacetylase AcuC-like enzyme
MIKREHLKQAIDHILSRDKEVGYTLGEMLTQGEIDILPSRIGESALADYGFRFRGQRVSVKKTVFFNEGLVSIEERLLIKYGELLKKEELSRQPSQLNFKEASQIIEESGFEYVIRHQINYIISSLIDNTYKTRTGRRLPGEEGDKSESSFLQQIAFLEKLSQEDPTHIFLDKNHPDFFFQGVVEGGKPAWFVRFPFCKAALLQVVQLNLEFFSLHFILNSFLKGNQNHLYACLVEDKIQGLLFLGRRTGLFYRGLEIKNIATLYGNKNSSSVPPYRPFKGVGTFLTAGVWLLWKSLYRDIHEVVLHSEVEAIRFYQSVGFVSRRPFEYVLKRPSSRLLEFTLEIIRNSPPTPDPVMRELQKLVDYHIRSTKRKRKSKKEKPASGPDLDFLNPCFQSGCPPELAETAVRTLLKYRRYFPETGTLVRSWEDRKARTDTVATPEPQRIALINDPRFILHLDNIFHLDSPKRIQAFQSILEHPSLKDRYRVLSPRSAEPEELAWVHTVDYINQVARTSGKTLTSLDLDTQTTEHSYEVARMAVGSVFTLLDEVVTGEIKKGFAFIRPPGHHAEPDRAMGFCLFNNVALGAMYLKRHYGAKKIMIVDIDAHHGNGIQRAFYETDEVLYVSMHQFPAYPGTGHTGETGIKKGEGYTVNIPLSKGWGDQHFAEIIHFLVDPIARVYQPHTLLVACGFDLYLHDRLTDMKGTPEGYALMTRMLCAIADQYANGRLVFILEGGYSITGIKECGLRVMQELGGISTLDETRIEKIGHGVPSKMPHIQRVKEIHKKYWPIL